MDIRNRKSTLLITSTKNDVIVSGGYLKLPGLPKFKLSDMVTMFQRNYTAEVSQVVTINDLAASPTVNTQYTVMIGVPNVKRQGWFSDLKPYSFSTPAVITTLGALAANQWNYIHTAIAAKINADANNFVVATVVADDLVITDDAGYNPYTSSQGFIPRGGASTVVAVTNSDGSGFAKATQYTLTTAAVYSFGDGTTWVTGIPVWSYYHGTELVSGDLDLPMTLAGLPPVTGQKYNGFIMEVLLPVETVVIGQQNWRVGKLFIAVDNGTGTSPANLAGYKAFEREMHRILFGQYEHDPKTVIEFFDKPMIFQDPAGAAPTGTTAILGTQVSPYAALNRINIGAQTIFVPVTDPLGFGLDISQDNAATEGSETSAFEGKVGVQEFVVGKEEFSVMARVVMGDWTDAAFKVGFRKKAAYNVTFNSNAYIAAIGNGSSAAGTIWINGDLVATNAGLAGAHVQAISAEAPVDAISKLFEILVDINGYVTAKADDVSFPIYSAGTTQMRFVAGDSMIAFYQTVNIANGDPDVVISEFNAVGTKNWKV